MALITFVGQNIGAGKFDRARKGLIETIKMTSILTLFLSLIVVIFSHQLMNLFISDPAVVEIGEKYLYFVGSFYVVFAVMFAYNGILRGAGDTLIPMFITLFSLWLIRIPCAYFLSNHFGVIGIWWSIPTGWLVGLIASYIYYKTGKWKSKRIISQVSPLEL